MDKRTWVALGAVFAITFPLLYKIETSCGKMGGLQHQLSLFLLAWIPGCIGLIGAKFERFKIPFFGEPSRFLFYSYLFSRVFVFYFVLDLDSSWYILVPLTLAIDLVLLWMVALGEAIFWWGYLYHKLEKYPPILSIVIIGLTQGLWQMLFFLVNLGPYLSYTHKFFFVPLVAMLLSPTLYYLRVRGRCILYPSVFFTPMLCYTLCSPEEIQSMFGMASLVCLFLLACVALVLLQRQKQIVFW